MQVYNWNKDSDRTETDGYSRGVAAGRDIMMADVVMDAGAVTSSHSHAYEEIIYVVKGKWTIKLGDENVTLEANQTLVIPSGIEHSSVAVEDTLAVVSTNYRPEWQENTDYWLHYNTENHLWAV